MTTIDHTVEIGFRWWFKPAVWAVAFAAFVTGRSCARAAGAILKRGVVIR